MTSDADMLEVQDAGLARLAELQLALAEKLYRLADATEDASEASDLAVALERTSRSVRLTYALRAKLRRDAKRAHREDADATARRDREQVRFKKHRLRTGVEALIWRETDGMDQEAEADFGDLLDALVDEEGVSETFLSEPLAAQVARVIAGLGYEITPEGTVRPHPRSSPRTRGPRLFELSLTPTPLIPAKAGTQAAPASSPPYGSRLPPGRAEVGVRAPPLSSSSPGLSRRPRHTDRT